MDAFADVNGVNSRGLSFYSSLDPPFGSCFEGQQVWAFPPPSLAERFLEEVEGWDCATVLALVPSHLIPKAQKWKLARLFSAGSRVFTRLHWGKR